VPREPVAGWGSRDSKPTERCFQSSNRGTSRFFPTMNIELSSMAAGLCYSVQCDTDRKVPIVDDEEPLTRTSRLFPRFSNNPGLQSHRWQKHSNAVVCLQVYRRFGWPCRRQIVRRATTVGRASSPTRTAIMSRSTRWPGRMPGVEAIANDVGQAAVGDDLELWRDRRARNFERRVRSPFSRPGAER